MAHTKQTARKSDSKGQLPNQSSSGHMFATFANRQSSRFLESNSDIERAADMFGLIPEDRHHVGPQHEVHPQALILHHVNLLA